MHKFSYLIRLLPTRPTEFWGRLATIVEVRAESSGRRRCTIDPVDWPRAVSELNHLWRVDLDAFLSEVELKNVEQEVSELILAMPKDAPFGSFHNGDVRLARLCYALARIIQPTVVVETGVCYGVTSAFLLKALKVNGRGTLHSIDLPPLGRDADQFVGKLIPANLRGSWTLYRGSSHRLLPQVLRGVGSIGLFVHDSLHTYRNMLREFETVRPYLAPKAAVVADDIEGNDAFGEWVAKVAPRYSVVLEEESKQSLLGLALFGNG